MSLPTVAIVGRPNVGKSSLLNCLAGRRISIVDPTPGVTRDRISTPVALGEKYVELVDTGGLGIVDSDHLGEHVENQIAFAVRQADLVLFVVDAREGVTPLDQLVAQMLRKAGKNVILLANKVDELHLVSEIHEFPSLGFGEPLAVSAIHHQGIAELGERIVQMLGDAAGARPPARVMKLAVVGKRNAGKSSFINALAGEERVIVSETPGTTRDSVDVTLELDGKSFTLIDTAGFRKRKSLAGDIEFYSYHRAQRSIRRADVVAMLVDASVKVSQVDKDLAGEVASEFKPVVLVVNKWDLAQGKVAGEDYQEYFDKTFPELSFAPISLTSATQGLNVRQTIHVARQLFEQASTRVTTGQLNAAIEQILQLRGPSHPPGTKPPKIYYASQIATNPPTIVCFVNDVRSFTTNYQRFLLNQLRERTPFVEVPIRLLFRQRQSDPERAKRFARKNDSERTDRGRARD